MAYSLRLSTSFQRQVKRLLKKYKSLSADLASLGEQLVENPELGTSLGRNCYKVRLAIRSKGRGKSGGARVITYVQVVGETIYLLSIYDKAEQDSLDDQDLNELLGEVEAD
ncbi:hypothetical protein GCM10027578_13930 [Spirosoma luteolum]